MTRDPWRLDRENPWHRSRYTDGFFIVFSEAPDDWWRGNYLGWLPTPPVIPLPQEPRWVLKGLAKPNNDEQFYSSGIERYAISAGCMVSWIMYHEQWGIVFTEACYA